MKSSVHRVFGILDVNNVNLSLSSGRGAGLYLTFARINHSCICNTRALKFKDHRWVVLAGRKKKQEGKCANFQFLVDVPTGLLNLQA